MPGGSFPCIMPADGMMIRVTGEITNPYILRTYPADLKMNILYSLFRQESYCGIMEPVTNRNFEAAISLINTE